MLTISFLVPSDVEKAVRDAADLMPVDHGDAVRELLRTNPAVAGGIAQAALGAMVKQIARERGLSIPPALDSSLRTITPAAAPAPLPGNPAVAGGIAPRPKAIFSRPPAPARAARTVETMVAAANGISELMLETWKVPDGRKLGDVKGSDLAGLAMGERRRMRDHRLNAALYAALAARVPADQTVRQAVSEDDVKNLWSRVRGEDDAAHAPAHRGDGAASAAAAN